MPCADCDAPCCYLRWRVTESGYGYCPAKPCSSRSRASRPGRRPPAGRFARSCVSLRPPPGRADRYRRADPRGRSGHHHLGGVRDRGERRRQPQLERLHAVPGCARFACHRHVPVPGAVPDPPGETRRPVAHTALSVSLQDIERRLAGDVTSGRGDDLRDAAASIAAGEGAGVEDIVISNDRDVRTVAHEVMSWLGWL